MPEREENYFRAELLFFPASEEEEVSFNPDELDDVHVSLAERIVSDEPLYGDGVVDFGELHPELGGDAAVDSFLRHIDRGEFGFLASHDDTPYTVSVTRMVMDTPDVDGGDALQEAMEAVSSVEVEDPIDEAWQDEPDTAADWRIWLTREACQNPGAAAAIIHEFIGAVPNAPSIEVVHPDQPDQEDLLPRELREPQLRLEYQDADWLGIPDIETEIGILKHIGAGVDFPEGLLNLIDEDHSEEDPTQNSIRLIRRKDQEPLDE